MPNGSKCKKASLGEEAVEQRVADQGSYMRVRYCGRSLQARHGTTGMRLWCAGARRCSLLLAAAASTGSMGRVIASALQRAASPLCPTTDESYVLGRAESERFGVCAQGVRAAPSEESSAASSKRNAVGAMTFFALRPKAMLHGIVAQQMKGIQSSSGVGAKGLRVYGGQHVFPILPLATQNRTNIKQAWAQCRSARRRHPEAGHGQAATRQEERRKQKGLGGQWPVAVASRGWLKSHRWSRRSQDMCAGKLVVGSVPYVGKVFFGGGEEGGGGQ